MSRLPFYDHIILSESEQEESDLQGKIKKYRRELHREYWEEKEKISPIKKRDSHRENE